jgi:hypothetical protein
MNPEINMNFIYAPWAIVGNFDIDYLLAANDVWSELGRDAAFVFLMGA